MLGSGRALQAGFFVHFRVSFLRVASMIEPHLGGKVNGGAQINFTYE
jgi:hypothetical protein